MTLLSLSSTVPTVMPSADISNQYPKLPPGRKRKRPNLHGRELAIAKETFYGAIAAGYSMTQAAKAAGVTANTGTVWQRKAKEQKLDLSRERLINLLSSRIGSTDTPPQYIAPLASLYADLQGYRVRKEDRIVLKSMHELFDSWRDERKFNDESVIDQSLPVTPSAATDTAG